VLCGAGSGLLISVLFGSMVVFGHTATGQPVGDSLNIVGRTIALAVCCTVARLFPWTWWCAGITIISGFSFFMCIIMGSFFSYHIMLICKVRLVRQEHGCFGL
jgi:hypothetical protein